MAQYEPYDLNKVTKDRYFLDIETITFPSGRTQVRVFARTVSGERVPNGEIFIIDDEGQLVRLPGVTPVLGFPLDLDGRVLLKS